MRVYTGEADGLTKNYHDDGGFVVIAENEEAAIARVKRSAPDKCEVKKITDIGLADNQGIDDFLWIYPDAGCC